MGQISMDFLFCSMLTVLHALVLSSSNSLAGSSAVLETIERKKHATTIAITFRAVCTRLVDGAILLASKWWWM